MSRSGGCKGLAMQNYKSLEQNNVGTLQPCCHISTPTQRPVGPLHVSLHSRWPKDYLHSELGGSIIIDG